MNFKRCAFVVTAQVVERVRDGRQAEFAQRLVLPAHHAGHDQHAAVDPGAAQRDAFVDRTDGQPSRAFGREDARHFHRAVPVGVGFDHADDVRLRAYRVADGAVVGGDAGAGNFDVAAGVLRHDPIVPDQFPGSTRRQISQQLLVLRRSRHPSCTVRARAAPRRPAAGRARFRSSSATCSMRAAEAGFILIRQAGIAAHFACSRVYRDREPGRPAPWLRSAPGACRRLRWRGCRRSTTNRVRDSRSRRSRRASRCAGSFVSRTCSM